MSRTTKEINEMVDDALNEYFSLTGPSLPTGTGAVHSEIGPFSQYVRSATDILDRILDIVNDDVADLEKLDVQEFLYTSVPRLQKKIDTLCDAIERKTGYKKLDKTRREPLTPPQERKTTTLKIK
jgi:hypothetical protein